MVLYHRAFFCFMKKEKYYCGATWVPRWLRKILSSKFNASCRVHDLDYETIRFDREEADTRFLMHMIRQAKNSLFWEIIATIYYLFCRTLGKLSWGKQEKH